MMLQIPFVGNRNFQSVGEIESTRLFKFVCEKPVNRRMLICVACGNGSFGYRIEPLKTRRQRLCLMKISKGLESQKGYRKKNLHN